VSEARRQRQQQELLDQAEKRLAELVEASDSAIISCDRLGVIQTWNKGVERMYGYRADDAIGGRVTVLVADDRTEKKQRLLEILSVDERVDGYAMTGRRKDGTVIDTSVDISPLRDLAGNVVGAWLIAQRAAKAKSA
jgi:PAS domain S-box-containing protein